jgi:3-oxoacyl-[acyl-carrier protein] reductase
MRLRGKVAIVTGAGSGFGAGIATRFAAEGAKVALLDINFEAAKTVAAEAGVDAVALRCDVTRGADVTEAEFDKIYAINVKSIFLMTQRATPILRDGGGGSIINIGSTAGVRPRPGLTWYNGSKGFVNLVSKSLAVELAPMNIRVNCIAPVLGQTGLTEDFMGGPATPELMAKFLSTIPLGRMSKPSDIASACVYLASDEGEFLTGLVLPVDGGRTI